MSVPEAALPPTEPAAPAQREEPRGMSLGTIWAGLAATLCAVLAAIYLAHLPEVIARWHWAAAFDHHLNGDRPAALAALEPAFGWSDDMPELYYQRGLWRMEAGDFAGANGDFDRADQLLPRAKASLPLRVHLHSLAAHALRRLGQCDAAAERHEAAVALVEKSYPEQRTSEYLLARAFAVNDRAYSHALCGTNLEQSLADMRQVLRDLDEVGGAPRSTYLDTQGYLRYRLGDFRGAAADFERAARRAERESNEQARRDVHSERFVDRRPEEAARRDRQREVAVIYHHRGLAYERLGRHFDAEQDFARARRLGYEPEHAVE